MVNARNSRFTRDDEATISCIHQDKNIDNEVHYVCIEFPDLINCIDYDVYELFTRVNNSNAYSYPKV
jgi:hypothetical protein